MLVFHQRFKKWLPPGGRIEADEDPFAGARRELFEETGLSPDPFVADPVLIDDWIDESASGERIETYGLSYAFVSPAGAALTGEPDQPAAWFPLAEMPEDAHPRHWTRVVDFAQGQRR